MRLFKTFFLLLAGLGSALAQSDSLDMQVAGIFHSPSADLYADIWGYTAPDKKEYALLLARKGLSVINITDRSNPWEVSFIPSDSAVAKDVKVYGHYAYVVTDDNAATGMQVIDLSALPDSAFEANLYTESGFAKAHNIWIDENRGILYSTESTPPYQYKVISLEDPLNPSLITVVPQQAHDFYTYGNWLYVSQQWEMTQGIWDATDPANPVLVQTIPMPGDNTIAHSSWTTKDGNYLITTEEKLDKTVKFWDIRDLENISLVDEYLVGEGDYKIAHNIYVMGDLAYVSHFRMGIRLLDISDPTRVREIAHYNPRLYDSQNIWGAFIFPSGTVIMSDIYVGLYVLEYTGSESVFPSSLESGAVIKSRAYGSRIFQTVSISNELSFFIPSPGIYTLNLYNGLGANKFKSKISIHQPGRQIIPREQLDLARGIYQVVVE